MRWKKLKLNVSKTKCMIVTTRRISDLSRTIAIDGEVIKRVEAIKYLGVMLDGKLNFNEHIDYTIRTAARKFKTNASSTKLKLKQVLQSKVMRLILRCDRLTSRQLMLDCLQ